MATIKNLSVDVTFSVDLRDVEVPDEVKNQLLEAHRNLDDIDSNITEGYDDANDWLVDNLRINDGFDFKCGIYNME